MIPIWLAFFAIIVAYLPFYFISNRIFEKYQFPLSFGLFYMITVLIGYILQFFYLIHIFPYLVAILYVIALKFGKFKKPDKWLVIIFIAFFVLSSLPLLFVETLPVNGGDVGFHSYLSKIIYEERTVYTNWVLMGGMEINYFFGFHMVVALISFLSISSLANTFFTLPAFLFSIMAISVYPIAREFGLDHEKGLFAVVMAGFGSLFALFPIVWGGYAQMGGMLAFAYTFFFMIKWTKRKNYKYLIFYSLFSAVLFLSHYMVFLMFVISLVSFWLGKREINFFIKSLQGPILGFVIISPWIFRLAYNTIQYNVGASLFGPTALNSFNLLMVTGPITLILAFLSKDKKFIPFYIWIIITLLLTQSNMFGFYPFNSGRWIYAVMIPLSILSPIGFYKFCGKYLKKIDIKILIITFLLLNVIVSESYFFYSSMIKRPPTLKEDYETFLYMKDNTPENEMVFISGSSGHWIPFISQRAIANPFLSNSEKNQDFIDMVELRENLYKNREWEKLKEININYYFISEEEQIPEGCVVVHKRLFICS